MVLQQQPTIDNEPREDKKNTTSKELQILLGRWPRPRGRWEHKQRDKNDVSTLPPKPKKPKVENATNYWYCFCGRPAIGRHGSCAIHMKSFIDTIT